MKTEQLEEIFLYARELFPHLQRITAYGSARFVNKKSLQDLQRLEGAACAGFIPAWKRDDVTLARINKGFTSAEIIEAGLKLKEAGLEVSEYYLVGIGGLDRTREHALESARVFKCHQP